MGVGVDHSGEQGLRCQTKLSLADSRSNFSDRSVRFYLDLHSGLEPTIDPGQIGLDDPRCRHAGETMQQSWMR